MKKEKSSRWTWDIFRWIRPHHPIETIKNPKRAIREIKYRYTFTSKIRFAADILSLSETLVFDILNELRQSELPSELDYQIKRHPASTGRGPMGDEAELLYLCVRTVKPALVVETGVGAGFSTAYILQGLKKNNHGKLYSIDFYKEDEQSGWIIPSDLKNRWKLIRGLSSEVLNCLLEQVGPIDFFIHDSEHSYENMMAEFRTVWPLLKSGGILLAHDVGRNDSFFAFCKEVNCRWWRTRTYGVLAGLRKT